MLLRLNLVQQVVQCRLSINQEYVLIVHRTAIFVHLQRSVVPVKVAIFGMGNIVVHVLQIAQHALTKVALSALALTFYTVESAIHNVQLLLF